MNPWNDMVSTALLGTARNAAPGSLSRLLDPLLAGTDAEFRLLRAAGISEVVEAAAQQPQISSSPMLAPSPSDPSQIASASELTPLLARLFEEGRPLLIEEACELLADASLCLPSRLIPRALELGRNTSSLRAALRPVLGKRGAWVAAQNPAWKFALLAGTEAADRRLWDEGDSMQRAAFLYELRQTDPSGARTLLEQAFPGETARARAILLPGLARNLGPDDEPFIASVLSADRSKEVRQIASRLLSRLLDSEFARRMTGRLQSSVSHAQAKLAIEPPQAFGADWSDDALEEKAPAGLKLGDRGWWLQQLVSLTPLVWWERHLNLDPADVLSHAAKSEWNEPLMAGFRAAILSQQDNVQWTLAFLKQGGLQHQDALRLALTLPPTDAHSVFEEILSTTGDSWLAAQVIESANFKWSPSAWHAAKKQLPHWLGQQDWRFRSALPVLACRVPRQFLHESRDWPDIPFFAEALDEFSRITDQRKTLYRVLSQ
jgi:hypothetical protein